MGQLAELVDVFLEWGRVVGGGGAAGGGVGVGACAHRWAEALSAAGGVAGDGAGVGLVVLLLCTLRVGRHLLALVECWVRRLLRGTWE